MENRYFFVGVVIIDFNFTSLIIIELDFIGFIIVNLDFITITRAFHTLDFSIPRLSH